MKSITFSAISEFSPVSRTPKPKPQRHYRNFLALANEWQAFMAASGLTQANTAHKKTIEILMTSPRSYDSGVCDKQSLT